MKDSAWLCRNCKHYHPIYVGVVRPENQCSNNMVSPSHSSYGCRCVNWESNNNLLYLEELSEKRHK